MSTIIFAVKLLTSGGADPNRSYLVFEKLYIDFNIERKKIILYFIMSKLGRIRSNFFLSIGSGFDVFFLIIGSGSGSAIRVANVVSSLSENIFFLFRYQQKLEESSE